MYETTTKTIKGMLTDYEINRIAELTATKLAAKLGNAARDDEDIIFVDEIAHMTGLKVSTIRAYARKGMPITSGRGRKLYSTRGAIKEWMLNR